MPTRPNRRRVEDLGDRIRATATARGVSTRALAAAAGLDASTVRRFLRGDTDLTLRTASLLCAALGLRLVESTRGTTRTPPARTVRVIDLAGEECQAEPGPEPEPHP